MRGKVLGADFQRGLDAYKNKDYATVLHEWKPLAEQGNTDAQTNLGQMYRKGLGVPQDHKTAVKQYRLAAERANPDGRVCPTMTCAN